MLGVGVPALLEEGAGGMPYYHIGHPAQQGSITV